MKKIFFLISFSVILILIFLVFNTEKKQTLNEMKIKSSSFGNNHNMPDKYSCQGEGVNPPLEFSNVPIDAKSLALVVDDPDAPMGTFVHWILYNISPSVKSILENSTPENAKPGKNSSGKIGYYPACPPSGTHRYFFKLYALDIELNFSSIPGKSELEAAMKGHVLDSSELIGLFSK